jgi:1-acyl-sn-glycerol-3-phosphate acyltransferase
MAAIKGGMPVVPIAISGTREMLGAGRALPRPVPIRIEILSPILPDNPAYGNHHELAEAARQRILSALDEPDLLATLD